MPGKVNWIDLRFGSLTVLEYAGKTTPTPGAPYGVIQVKCRCDCGKETIVRTNNLRSGNTSSCDCNNARYTHRMTKTPEYRAWERIIDRCHNPNRANFRNYGGRGIAVCDRWRFGESGKAGFECFYEDVGPRPEGRYASGRAKYWLERRNNDLGYSKDNCCWATVPQQLNNKRDNRFVSYDGKTKTIAQWTHEHGLPDHVIRNRLGAGWLVSAQLFRKEIAEAAFAYERKITTVSEWAQIFGLNAKRLHIKLLRGQPVGAELFARNGIVPSARVVKKRIAVAWAAPRNLASGHRQYGFRTPESVAGLDRPPQISSGSWIAGTTPQ